MYDASVDPTNHHYTSGNRVTVVALALALALQHFLCTLFCHVRTAVSALHYATLSVLQF